MTCPFSYQHSYKNISIVDPVGYRNGFNPLQSLVEQERTLVNILYKSILDFSWVPQHLFQFQWTTECVPTPQTIPIKLHYLAILDTNCNRTKNGDRVHRQCIVINHWSPVTSRLCKCNLVPIHFPSEWMVPELMTKILRLLVYSRQTQILTLTVNRTN